MKLTALQQRQMQNERLKEMTAQINAPESKYGYFDEQLAGWIDRNDWRGSEKEARTAIEDARSLYLA